MPVKKRIARINVDTAISASDRTINSLRSNRSAQTPAKGEINKVGRNPHKIEMVIITPDWVSSVIYQVMAYCTSMDPNREKVWLDKNKIVFFFQLACCIIITPCHMYREFYNIFQISKEELKSAIQYVD